MESKVWNALFRDVIALQPESEKNGPDAPATSVTAEEAATFAWAAFGKTARLPSPEEMDHAAGLYAVNDRDEVTRRGGQPRVRIAKPEHAHGPQGIADVNEFGLLDMAGNGREFTRQIQTKPGEPAREVVGGSTTPLADTDMVILRGRNFTLSTPLTFSTLRYEQTTPQRQLATARSPYTSFRVVLPAPVASESHHARRPHAPIVPRFWLRACPSPHRSTPMMAPHSRHSTTSSPSS